MNGKLQCVPKVNSKTLERLQLMHFRDLWVLWINTCSKLTTKGLEQHLQVFAQRTPKSMKSVRLNCSHAFTVNSFPFLRVYQLDILKTFFFSLTLVDLFPLDTEVGIEFTRRTYNISYCCNIYLPRASTAYITQNLPCFGYQLRCQ